MKRILILVMLTAGVSAAKAQLLTPFNPNIKLNDSLIFFKPADHSPKSFLLQPDQLTIPAIFTDKNTSVVYNRMPVVRLSATDKMPVANAGRPANRDNMPVLKIKIIDPLAKNEQQTP